MRFLQPVGVIQQNNDFLSINVNLISSENQQITRLSGNNFANVTETLNRTELISSENINNFDTKVVAKNTTTLQDILKLNPDSRYFRNYLDSQLTDTNNVDLANGNNDVIFISTLKFCENNLSEVRA